MSGRRRHNPWFMAPCMRPGDCRCYRCEEKQLVRDAMRRIEAAATWRHHSIVDLPLRDLASEHEKHILLRLEAAEMLLRMRFLAAAFDGDED